MTALRQPEAQHHPEIAPTLPYRQKSTGSCGCPASSGRCAGRRWRACRSSRGWSWSWWSLLFEAEGPSPGRVQVRLHSCLRGEQRGERGARAKSGGGSPTRQRAGRGAAARGSSIGPAQAACGAEGWGDPIWLLLGREGRAPLSRSAQHHRAGGATSAGARRRPARLIVTEGGNPLAGFRGAGTAGGIERIPKDAPFLLPD